MDKNKQIKYWLDLSFEDIDTAFILFDKKKYKECLFFAHLSLEKILKAHYVKANSDFAPKTHNLFYLISKVGFTIDVKYDELIALLMTYQLEGRYPDYKPLLPDNNEIEFNLKLTKELLKWLTSLL